MDIVRIPLTKGKIALVDATDFKIVAGIKWCAWQSRPGGLWYATSSTYGPLRRNGGVPKRGMIYMHRLILGAPDGIEVDHGNGDGLDNRRCNLRQATRVQNAANQGMNIKNTSGFMGVSWSTARGLWEAYISARGVRHNVRRFATAEQAARARDAKARDLHGDFARLNFPD